MIPEMTAINGAFAAVKSALDITKSIKDLNSSQAAKTQILELHEKLVSLAETVHTVQIERTTLLQRISGLEEETARFKAWGREKEQYEPKNVDIGALAYAPKPRTEAAKEPHWLCAQCAEEGKKSYLQAQKGDMYFIHWTCGVCRNFIRVRHGKSPLNPTCEQKA